MTASNQLLDGDILRSEISLQNLVWASSDPGTGILPANRILTWAQYKTYVASVGTTQLADGQCPDYSTALTYRLFVTAPSSLSTFNASFCDGSLQPHYRIQFGWTNGNASYSTAFQISYDNSNWSEVIDATAGATSVTYEGVSFNTTVYARCFHAYTFGGSRISNYSNTASVFIGALPC